MTKGLRMSEAQFAALTGHKKLPSGKADIGKKSVAIAGGYRSRVQGERTIGGKTHYFRSLWEMNFAHYLAFQEKHGEILSWEYEAQKFVFPYEVYGREPPFSYLPDFKVIHKNGFVEYVEVKGVLNAMAKKKIKRMKETYPDIKLTMIMKPWFQAAKRKGWDKLMRFEKLSDSIEA